MTEPKVPLALARKSAEEKRKRLTDATDALKNHVEEEAAEINALVVRGKQALVVVDENVRAYRWVAFGASVAIGLALGRGRAKKKRRERILDESEHTIVVTPAKKRPSFLNSVLGSVATIVAKEVALRVVASLQPDDE
ncbi:MAG: hypothetical protein RMA76_20535 [Deltaproteobacteria bacterium]|jgi:ElaB/YqjD/DUF883 family membrane-anchored ribosome-binding protein